MSDYINCPAISDCFVSHLSWNAVNSRVIVRQCLQPFALLNSHLANVPFVALKVRIFFPHPLDLLYVALKYRLPEWLSKISSAQIRLRPRKPSVTPCQAKCFLAVYNAAFDNILQFNFLVFRLTYSWDICPIKPLSVLRWHKCGVNENRLNS